MEKWKAVRVLEILATGLDKATPDDMRYLTNHVEPFSEFMLDVATQQFIADGVDPDKVEAILKPLVEVSKMAGANSFHDYAFTQMMAEEETKDDADTNTE